MIPLLLSSKKSLPDTSSQRFYPMFPSGSFIVLDSTFRSAIYFQLIFACCARHELKLLVLHMDAQLLQHHLLKDYAFFIEIITFPPQILVFLVSVGYLWIFYFNPLILFSIFTSVLYCLEYYRFVEILKSDSSSPLTFFLFPSCFGYSRSFAF